MMNEIGIVIITYLQISSTNDSEIMTLIVFPDCIAGLRGMAAEELAAVTADNFFRLFRTARRSTG